MDIFEELLDNQRLYNTYMLDDAEVAKQKFREAKAYSISGTRIDKKTTELIILAIAITAKCEGCIASHAQYAIKAGATMDEIGTLIAICTHMTGSVSAFFGGKALRYAEMALKELEEAKEDKATCELC